MKTTNAQDEIIAFIMEPEEELLALRFIALHRGTMKIKETNFWDCESESEQAMVLKLQGGYQYHFHNLAERNLV